MFPPMTSTTETSPNANIPSVAPQADPLARALKKLDAAAAGKDKLSLGTVLSSIGTEGPSLAAALLTLPFLQPIPMMGLSTPIGLTIAISGVGLFLEREVILPRRLSQAELPASSVLKTTEFFANFEKNLSRYLKSDTQLDSRFMRRFLGAAIAIHGFLLALPLPIPFTNTMPAWMCLFGSLTILFSSRRLFWLTMLMILANVVFWTSLVLAALWGVPSLVEWLGVTS